MRHGEETARFVLNVNGIYMCGGEACVEIKIKIKAKGYSLKELGKRWGLKERQMYNIQREPSQRDIDAVNGLPRKKSAL